VNSISTSRATISALREHGVRRVLEFEARLRHSPLWDSSRAQIVGLVPPSLPGGGVDTTGFAPAILDSKNALLESAIADAGRCDVGVLAQPEVAPNDFFPHTGLDRERGSARARDSAAIGLRTARAQRRYSPSRAHP
jgi:hypothetical protein